VTDGDGELDTEGDVDALDDTVEKLETVPDVDGVTDMVDEVLTEEDVDGLPETEGEDVTEGEALVDGEGLLLPEDVPETHAVMLPLLDNDSVAETEAHAELLELMLTVLDTVEVEEEHPVMLGDPDGLVETLMVPDTVAEDVTEDEMDPDPETETVTEGDVVPDTLPDDVVELLGVTVFELNGEDEVVTEPVPDREN
jgi:hypothetical protein